VTHKRLIVLLGVFLGSQAPAVAQSPAPRIVLPQVRLAPHMTMLRTAPSPLPAASFLLSQEPGRSPADSSNQLAGAYEGNRSPQLLPPTEDVKTVFFTQSSLPLVQLWRGRLQLDAFQSALYMHNAQFGPSGYRGTQGFLSARQSYPDGASSAGLSLNFHFGRDARTGHPAQPWRRMTRFVGAVLE